MGENSFYARFCTRTTAHGFPDFYLAKGWLAKAFWGISLLGAIVAVVYYNYTMVLQFLSKPSATLISYNDVEQIQFPNITICSNQMFNSTFVKSNIVFNDSVKSYLQYTYGFDEAYIKTNFISYLSLQLLNYIPFEKPTDAKLIGILESVYSSMLSDPNVKDIYNFYFNARFHCETFLIECVFAGNTFDCCKFARPVMTTNGICYHMHFDESQISTGAFQTVEGRDSGFVITTQVNQKDGVQSDIATRIDYSQEDGIEVHTTDYVSLLDFNPMVIPPFTHATIRLVATQYSVNQDNEKCYKDGQTFKLAYREAYTPNLCRQECASNVSMQRCSCYDPVYYVTAPADVICSPLQMLQCVYPTMYGTNSTEATLKTQSCINDKCWQTCQYWLYEPIVMYSQMLVNDEQADVIRTKMTIYYSQLQYEAVEEELLMNTETFVSNVGGICGLWIGMSLMSIVQFFYILLCGSCEKKQNQKVEQDKSKSV